MQISLRVRRCHAVARLASLLVFGAACAGVAQAGSEADIGYEFARVTYASDYCTQLRWQRPEADNGAEDDSDEDATAPATAVLTAADTPGASATPAAPAQGGSADAGQGRSADIDADADAPELLLSSRFNHESCEGNQAGAVVDDTAQLPLLIAGLQAVHEALAVQPDWIDDGNLPLDWQGCWRRNARLGSALVESTDGRIALYLDVQDCAGEPQRVKLELRPASEEQPHGYRSPGGILATLAPILICGSFIE